MLYHDFLTNEQKQIHKHVRYFPVYEQHFQKFVNQSVIFWEIGVAKGGSLQMWKRYLGPFAKIVGIDINPVCKQLEEPQISICIGDSSDNAFLQKVIDKHGAPDIILDDGSHQMKDVCATFNFMYDKVKNNGIYFVEDMHCAYREGYGGGLGREGTFIELCKDLIDSLNARSNGLPRSFADSTYSMSFYPSIVVFEKREWLEDSFSSLKIPNKDIEPLNTRNNYYDILQTWFDLKSRNVNVSDYLLKHNYCNIAIYGMGSIGRLLYNDLKNTGVKVKYYVDKNKAELDCFGLRGFTLESIQKAEAVDAMIITPYYDSQLIRDEMGKCINVHTIAFDKLIQEIFNTPE